MTGVAVRAKPCQAGVRGSAQVPSAAELVSSPRLDLPRSTPSVRETSGDVHWVGSPDGTESVAACGCGGGAAVVCTELAPLLDGRE